MENDAIEEGVGESSWPAAADRGPSSTGGGYTDIRKEIFDRLMAKGIEEVVSDPPAFREQLDRHFERLPASYSIDLDVEKAEDVLLHRRILDECADPDKRPVFHVRFLRCVEAPVDSEDKALQGPSTREYGSTSREIEFKGSEPCERMMEDLSLERRKVVDDSEASSARYFSTRVITQIPEDVSMSPEFIAILLSSAIRLNLKHPPLS